MDVKHQYDDMGNDYVTNKESLDIPRDTFCRDKLYSFLGPLDGKVVIDAGCGNGGDTPIWIEQGAAKVFAFDPSEKMLEDGRLRFSSKNSNIVFEKGSFELIPFEDNSADVLIGMFSLHYVKHMDDAYQEMVRVVKSGGKIGFIAQHPFDTQLNKKDMYGPQEVVTCTIFNETVTVTSWSHVLADYLSPYFLQHFTLDHYTELPTDDFVKVWNNTGLMVFTATKK